MIDIEDNERFQHLLEEVPFVLTEAKLVRKRPNLANGHDRDEGTMHRALEVELRRNLLAEVLVAHQRE